MVNGREGEKRGKVASDTAHCLPASWPHKDSVSASIFIKLRPSAQGGGGGRVALLLIVSLPLFSKKTSNLCKECAVRMPLFTGKKERERGMGG